LHHKQGGPTKPFGCQDCSTSIQSCHKHIGDTKPINACGKPRTRFGHQQHTRRNTKHSSYASNELQCTKLSKHARRIQSWVTTGMDARPVFPKISMGARTGGFTLPPIDSNSMVSPLSRISPYTTRTNPTTSSTGRTRNRKSAQSNPKAHL